MGTSVTVSNQYDFDFGNFLWGRAMAMLRFSERESLERADSFGKWFGDRDSFFSLARGDDSADQRAILMGHRSRSKLALDDSLLGSFPIAPFVTYDPTGYLKDYPYNPLSFADFHSPYRLDLLHD